MKAILMVAMLSVVSLVSLAQNPKLTHNRFTEDGKTFSLDGGQVMADCMAKPEESCQEAAICAGYIAGVADLLSDRSLCIPPEVSVKQLVKVVQKYGAKNENMLHGPASRVVANALQDAYPCSGKR